MTIIAAYQQTPEGQAAVLRAIAEAELRKTDLVVVTAPAHGNESISSIAELEALSTSGPAAVVRPAVRPDHLADEVVDLAAEINAELIVIGLRRRSPVGKLLLGSAAQDILLDSTVPVLAVRAAG